MSSAEADSDLPMITLEPPRDPAGAPDLTQALATEWLVTNGIGGYASGTLALCNTRRYHGLFIPNLPAPLGRTVMLPRLEERFTIDGVEYRLDGEEHTSGALHLDGLPHLTEFRLRGLLPEWDFTLGPTRLRRRLMLVHGENTLVLHYQHLSGPGARVRLRPFTSFRFHDRPLPPRPGYPLVQLRGTRVEVLPVENAPAMRFKLWADCESPFVSLPQTSAELLFRVERARGLDHREEQSSPGYFDCALSPQGNLSFGVTVGGWGWLDRDPLEAFELEWARQRRILERAPMVARTGTAARLVLAADQFIVEPATRPHDEAWARAIGQDARSVIAGYHWFTDWGRDTMISLEGLTLTTGRRREAAAILRTFRHYVRDGLLPNLFPEGGREGLYHTADATLWFFHAIDRYVEVTGDAELARDFFPTLEEIIEHHLRGTRFGIQVDPSDGLLRQGAPGYQLTWMDAKVDGWVVTPRRGKAVEINALWFNALRLMADWSQRVGQDPQRYLDHAERAQASFNQRFWNDAAGCLFDVVDAESGGDDDAARPNQLFAISLKHPVLRRDRWQRVLELVQEDLLTPHGLRTLSPRHPDYKPRYDGDLRARDAAYHQGTVWAWLVGHFVDAWLKVHPSDPKQARRWLEGLEGQLRHAGVGSISEIFDASEPYRPRGCIAQAWSVAELLRAWVRTA